VSLAGAVSGAQPSSADLSDVANIIFSTSSYANPAWITTLAAAKLTGAIPAGNFPALGGDVGNTAGSTTITVNRITGQNASLGGPFTVTGAFPLTFTIGAATNLGLPAAGTLATLNGTETFQNKTIVTPTIASFINAAHSHLNAAGGGTLGAAALVLVDDTVNNASPTAHGFVAKLTNVSTDCYLGTGIFGTCGGGGGGGGAGGGGGNSTAFVNASNVTVGGLGTPNVTYACYNPNNIALSPDGVTISGSTPYNVTFTFASVSSGRCVITGMGRYVSSLQSGTTWTLNQAAHGFSTYGLNITLYDNGATRHKIEPDSYNIDPSTFLITINFLAAQTGYAVIE
jgi:hypothetical protein